MPKINVYLPDDLADSVRESGIPVSAICQRALEQAVQRVTTIRTALLDNLDATQLTERLPSFTARLITVVTLAAQRARDAGRKAVTTGDLLHGMLAEGNNLALQILTAMDIAPASLNAPETAEPGGATGKPGATTGGPGSATSGPSGSAQHPGGAAEGLRFSRHAAMALEQTVGEAIGFGHNYVGCEHLLVALTAEPDGAAGRTLRDRGADAKSTRRAVGVALAGYAHLRTNLNNPGAPAMTGLLTAVRAEIAPLIARIERLEAATK
ncbi:MAG: Clp protease N-terminal domain-containing protein [Actinomycetota bacterium]|nr:Clp protease N-terminal domain-containing protein [Actinomycetota bacterium]